MWFQDQEPGECLNQQTRTCFLACRVFCNLNQMFIILLTMNNQSFSPSKTDFFFKWSEFQWHTNAISRIRENIRGIFNKTNLFLFNYLIDGYVLQSGRCDRRVGTISVHVHRAVSKECNYTLCVWEGRHSSLKKSKGYCLQDCLCGLSSFDARTLYVHGDLDLQINQRPSHQ